MMENREAEFAYAAGIVDGEGGVTIMKISHRGSVSFHAKVTVTNTDARLIEWLLEKFDGSFYLGTCTSSQHRTIFKWFLQGQKAVSFLESIKPYLITKQAQVDTLMSLQRLKAEYSMWSGRRVSETYHEEANALKETMLILNAKGG